MKISTVYRATSLLNGSQGKVPVYQVIHRTLKIYKREKRPKFICMFLYNQIHLNILNHKYFIARLLKFRSEPQSVVFQHNSHWLFYFFTLLMIDFFFLKRDRTFPREHTPKTKRGIKTKEEGKKMSQRKDMNERKKRKEEKKDGKQI